MSTALAAAPPGPQLTLNNEEFEALRAIVYAETGISLSVEKKVMLASRLIKRLRETGQPNYLAYARWLGTAEGRKHELQDFINSVTTNKTSFFRESHQFDFLRDTLVPEWVERAKKSGTKTIRIWSAAASTGQEPWTIAAVLAAHLPNAPSWDVRILGTDIDTQVLTTAQAGLYDVEDCQEVPEPYRRFFEKTADGKVRISDALRGWLKFRRLNLVAPAWPIDVQFDVIFCRNVCIYFDHATQVTLYDRLVSLLPPRGWLCVGHSEVLHWMMGRLDAHQGGIYRLKQGAPSADKAPRPAKAPSVPAPVKPAVDLPLKRFVINSGEMHAAGGEPCEIKTLLGSCVAACLYDPATGIGGMNHFLLPSSSDDGIERLRFGSYAMETLINAIMKLGAERSRLKAKIFGGGNVLGSVTQRPTVGERNIEFAKKYLEQEHIPIVGSQLGGSEGVEVRFQPHTGKVLIRAIGRHLLDLKKEATPAVVVVPESTVELF